MHCVIIGFSETAALAKVLLFSSDNQFDIVSNISPYLVAAPTVFVEAHSHPVSSNAPVLQNGGKPTEGGHLILTQEERDDLLRAEPQAAPFLRPFMMGKDFLHRAPRYCLWLVHAEPALLKRCPRVLERVEAVRAFRLDSKKPAPRRKAETPMLFDEVRECTSNYIAIPKVSSENRRYIPMDYLPKEIIPGDNLFMLQDATLYHFGILMSNVHMAWMRAVAGRMKSDYRYSTSIVYNNFPWPTPTPEQTAAIKKTAQAILDARELYPDSSLADLYDEVLMPRELREAHRANDRAVMRAYGFPIKMTEADCVAALMQMYEQLTAGK